MDSPLALSIIGLAVILGTVGLLLSNRAHPVVAMTLVPVAGALIAGFGPSAIGEFFGSGLESVMNVVVMFVFAIVFFGMLSDAGFFLPVVGSLIRATKGRVLAGRSAPRRSGSSPTSTGRARRRSSSPSPRCCRSTRRCT